MLLTLGEGYFGSGACYAEAPSLLPGSHYCGLHLASPSIIASEG